MLNNNKKWEHGKRKQCQQFISLRDKHRHHAISTKVVCIVWRQSIIMYSFLFLCNFKRNFRNVKTIFRRKKVLNNLSFHSDWHSFVKWVPDSGLNDIATKNSHKLNYSLYCYGVMQKKRIRNPANSENGGVKYNKPD